MSSVAPTPILADGRARAQRRRAPLALRLAAVPVTAATVVVGLWLTAGVITNDFTLSMRLSVGWMALAGLAALAVAVRSRDFRWPVLGAYAVTALAIGAWLGSSLFMDRVVNEQVAKAAPRGTVGPHNTLVRAGRFEGVRHGASGDAQVIRLAGGGRVLTLTNLDVARGPDLRVYLVTGPATTESEVDDHVDLGGLKGNKGNQQYDIPDDVSIARYSTAVIWCRAFSVLFARAPLGPPE